jgi:hypothetical protein
MTAAVIGTDHAERARRDLRYERTVTRWLQSADAAAAREDYVHALAWLRNLDALGYRLDHAYEARREEWLLKVEADRAGGSQWFG